MDKNHIMNVNVPILGILGVMFIGLKLGNIITWPWLWVLSPFWIPFASVLVVFAIIMCAGFFIRWKEGKLWELTTRKKK